MISNSTSALITMPCGNDILTVCVGSADLTSTPHKGLWCADG
jgi:hypothetical protein